MKLPSRIATTVLFLTMLIIGSVHAQTTRYSPGPYHPMDALTIDEVLEAVGLLEEAGLADQDTRYPTITLKEMPKAQVRAWRRGQPFTRSAFVVMRAAGETREAVVSLTDDEVVSQRVVPGAQPAVMDEEWQEAERLTMADPRWQAAMQSRGITDFSAIFCAPMTAGSLPVDGGAERRLLKVTCYDTRRDSTNPHGWPVEGVLAVVDVDAGTVIEVLDSGMVAIPQAVEKTSAPEPAERSAPKPVVMASPEGSNFEIRGNYEVSWQNWSFHVRADRRFGPIVSLVRFRDGERQRDIAYQMALSEMFVPYMDPDPQWSFRTFLDVGEYGLGYLASPLRPGADCPYQSAFIPLVMPSDIGELFQIERGLCIFERTTGDPLWRHAEAGADTSDSRPEVELVVRMIPALGNYDYVIDWVFTQRGNITIRVGATGFNAVRTVGTRTMTDENAAADTRHGTLVSPNLVAPFHDHFFSFRLDLDVDGPANTLVRDSILRKDLPDGNPRRSIWVVEPEPIQSEGPVTVGHDELYRLINPGSTTALGHAPGIHVEPGHNALSLLAPNDLPQARAAFSAAQLWLTRHQPDELYAAGAYPNQSTGGEGLPAYVGDRGATVDTDVVVWYTMGFHHVTRAEDWPILPTKWHQVTLRPFNFFDRNPSADVPPPGERYPAAQSDAQGSQ